MSSTAARNRPGAWSSAAWSSVAGSSEAGPSPATPLAGPAPTVSLRSVPSAPRSRRGAVGPAPIRPGDGGRGASTAVRRWAPSVARSPARRSGATDPSASPRPRRAEAPPRGPRRSAPGILERSGRSGRSELFRAGTAPRQVDCRGATSASRRTAGSVRTGGARLRLTRLGRLVVLTLCASALVAAVLLAQSLPMLSSSVSGLLPEADAPSRTVTVTVASGETLWQVAQRLAPERDPRATIHDIRALNGLDTAAVLAGQEVVVPVP